MVDSGDFIDLLRRACQCANRTKDREGASMGARTKVAIGMKTAKDSYSAVSDYAGADGKWTTVSVINATRAK